MSDRTHSALPSLPALLALSVLLLPGAVPSASAQQDASPLFVDVTSQAGVDFTHQTGGFGKKWLPETMGSGVIVFDADGDDRLDLLFLNGRSFSGVDASPGDSATQKLYLNRSDDGGPIRFTDGTAKAGLGLNEYCMGGAAGDLDADGDADLYLSCLG
ncbi:MAG: hypothetical protein PVG07_12965, partial [Acidobacteriota bacterium]